LDLITTRRRERRLTGRWKDGGVCGGGGGHRHTQKHKNRKSKRQNKRVTMAKSTKRVDREESRREQVTTRFKEVDNDSISCGRGGSRGKRGRECYHFLKRTSLGLSMSDFMAKNQISTAGLISYRTTRKHIQSPQMSCRGRAKSCRTPAERRGLGV